VSDTDDDGLTVGERRLMEERDRYRAALERIRDERERVPVKKTTGVSGGPRFTHSWPARFIATEALGEDK
jgi:hypothetical protein